MKIYSYRLDHDYGLAPNPFGTYCTLVVCKTKIRRSKNLKIGDWIIGTGSKALEKVVSKELTNRLIYAMKVKECLTLNEYWNDNRFLYKKPNMKGSLVSMFGDNFYYLDSNQKWGQIDCAHRNPDGSLNDKHIKTDTKGKNAIIAEVFYYFGENAIEIPSKYKNVIHSTQGEKIVKPEELGFEFIIWLEKNFKTGIHGDPLNWIEIKNNK